MIYNRITAYIRIIIFGCEQCKRHFTTTEDGYLCDKCDYEFCDLVARAEEKI